MPLVLGTKKPALSGLSQIAAQRLDEGHSGITHFKESGDVYLHAAAGALWIVTVLVGLVIYEVSDDERA